jgi:hypothetical protein|tara:strand:- start:2790 stop:3113 length:324 start_codon:yes stop_codon:yes gene_type:complete
VQVIRVKNKVIGEIIEIPGDKVLFVKVVYGPRHRLRKPPAWSIDAQAYDKLIRPAVQGIRIEDKETSPVTVYQSSIANFDAHKGVIDRGYGRQYFMILDRWDTSRGK